MDQRGTEARAEPRDWLRTVRQSLPRVFRIARSMRPTWDFGSLDMLDSGFLHGEGIGALLWDVDGTLTHYHAHELAPEIRSPVESLFRDPGLRHAIVSNCDDVRLAELATMFPTLPVLKLYEAGRTRFGRELRHGADRWFEVSDAGAAPIDRPDRALTPLRKPAAEIIRFAVDRLGLDPHETAMVGDQYWTDVAGANLGGIRSIRVPTVGRSSFPPAIRTFQRADAWMRRLLA